MKKISLYFTLIFFGCLLFGSRALAATYYVSTLGTDDISHGSSSGTGALKTMQYAHTRATNGDTVYVEAGTYVEVGSGAYGGLYMNPAKGITWIAQGTVMVQPDSNSATAFIYIEGSSQNISFTGFTFDFGSNNAGPIYLKDTATGTYTFNDCNFTSTVSAKMFRLILGSGSMVINNSTINCSGDIGTVSCIDNYGNMTVSSSTINVYTAKNLSINRVPNLINNTINIGSADDVFNISRSNTFSMTGNTFTVTSSIANLFYLYAPTITGAFTIQNNVFSGNATFSESFAYLNQNDGITLDINNNTFDFPNARSTYIWEIFATATTTISENTFNTASTSNSTPVSIKGYKKVNSLQILNNVFNMHSATSYMIAIGLDANSAPTTNNNLDGVVIRGNKFLGVSYWDRNSGLSQATHAILVGYNVNATIESNFIAGAGYGMVLKGSGMEYTSGGVHNNILYNNVAAGGLSKGMGGVKYYNNTIYYDLNDSANGIDIAKNLDTELSPNTKVRNNIFYGNSYLNPISIDTANDGVAFESDSNLFYLTTGRASELDDSKYNLNSIGLDPKFVSTSTQDFYLRNTSPAIGSGLNLSSEYTDGLSKNTIFPDPTTTTRSTWDLGAYVYSDGISISPTTLNINEGATSTYTIVLDSQPTNDVVINISSDSKSSVNLSTVTFTSVNWNIPQIITVTAIEDSINETDTYSSIIHYLVSSDDGSYDNLPMADMNIVIADNEPNDSTPPASSVSINSDETHTSTSTVTLTLTAEDETSATSSLQMMISNDSDFLGADWESYSEIKSWLISGTIGTNTVYFKVKDEVGNISATSSDVIIFDNVAPAITILGANPISMYKGGSYTDSGATALDNVDGDISANIIRTNTVDTAMVGIYDVIYDVSDHAGNSAGPAIRRVIVLNRPNSGTPIYFLKKTNGQNQSNEIVVNNTVQENIVKDGCLFKYGNDSRVYVLENGSKRWIQDEYTFNSLGYSFNNVITISSSNIYPSGDDIFKEKQLFVFTRTLKPGQMNNEVRQLQTVLKKLGYFIYKDITGFYGKQTYNAVLRFQKASKLKQTGILNSDTIKKLNNR